MRVFISTLLGETFSVDADARWTVSTLKRHIELEKGIPQPSQQLLWNNRCLAASERLGNVDQAKHSFSSRSSHAVTGRSHPSGLAAQRNYTPPAMDQLCDRLSNVGVLERHSHRHFIERDDSERVLQLTLITKMAAAPFQLQVEETAAEPDFSEFEDVIDVTDVPDDLKDEYILAVLEHLNQSTIVCRDGDKYAVYELEEVEDSGYTEDDVDTRHRSDNDNPFNSPGSCSAECAEDSDFDADADDHSPFTCDHTTDSFDRQSRTPSPLSPFLALSREDIMYRFRYNDLRTRRQLSQIQRTLRRLSRMLKQELERAGQLEPLINFNHPAGQTPGRPTDSLKSSASCKDSDVCDGNAPAFQSQDMSRSSCSASRRSALNSRGKSCAPLSSRTHKSSHSSSSKTKLSRVSGLPSIEGGSVGLVARRQSHQSAAKPQSNACASIHDKGTKSSLYDSPPQSQVRPASGRRLPPISTHHSSVSHVRQQGTTTNCVRTPDSEKRRHSWRRNHDSSIGCHKYDGSPNSVCDSLHVVESNYQRPPSSASDSRSASSPRLRGLSLSTPRIDSTDGHVAPNHNSLDTDADLNRALMRTSAAHDKGSYRSCKEPSGPHHGNPASSETKDRGYPSTPLRVAHRLRDSPASSRQSSGIIPLRSARSRQQQLGKASRRKKKKKGPRCHVCDCKLSALLAFKCRCDQMFCAKHRYPEEHACTFDFAAMERDLLRERLVAAKPRKLPDI